MTERRRLSARFPKRPSRGMLLGFSGPRVAALGAAALVALVGVLAFGAAGLVLVVVWLPIALSAFVRIGGQPAVEWFPTWIHFAGRRHAGQTEYRSRLPVQARPAGVMALPGDAAALALSCGRPIGGGNDRRPPPPHAHRRAGRVAIRRSCCSTSTIRSPGSPVGVASKRIWRTRGRSPPSRCARPWSPTEATTSTTGTPPTAPTTAAGPTASTRRCSSRPACPPRRIGRRSRSVST